MKEKSWSFWSIVGLIVVVAIVLVGLFRCGILGTLTYKWLTPVDTNTADAYAQMPTPVPPQGGNTTFPQEERVCKYADGFTAEGKVVSQGTKVVGPALVKPNRDLDHVLLVMPGAEYLTKATDEVIWLLVGDEACVNSQAMFFSTSETIDN